MTKQVNAIKTAELRNRIKELRYVDTADIEAHPGNWREHPQAQADALTGVLREVGIADALLCYESERNGKLTLIDGHLRRDAAPGKWPVLVLDVDDAEADYLLATFDPLTSMAQADKAALDALLSGIQSGEAAVQAMLAEEAAKAGLYRESANGNDADASPVAIPEQYMVLIECASETEQAELLQRFTDEGLKCRALLS